MNCVSMIDHETRVEIHEILARFCHYIVDGDATLWAGLFTPTGTLTCDGQTCAQGTAQLTAAAERIRLGGTSMSRHVITSVMIDAGPSRREILVRASGLVIDMNLEGLSEFYDYRFHVRKLGSWRIDSLEAHRIGKDTDTPFGIFGNSTQNVARPQRTDDRPASHLVQ